MWKGRCWPEWARSVKEVLDSILRRNVDKGGRQIGTRGEKIIFSNIGFLDHAGESCFNRWIIMYFASRKFFWDLQISRQQFARLSPPSQGSSLQIDAFQAPLISASHIHNPAFQLIQPQIPRKKCFNGLIWMSTEREKSLRDWMAWNSLMGRRSWTSVCLPSLV